MIVAVFSFLLACNLEPEPSAVTAPLTAGAHAGPGVRPGSHADWCGEHAVPESQCSRCDPALIPAFQAMDDWCGEHGLPDSQCLQCSPELKLERPPKEG